MKIEATPKEIADLIKAIQGRPRLSSNKTMTNDEIVREVNQRVLAVGNAPLVI